jgi:hypothetical protein
MTVRQEPLHQERAAVAAETFEIVVKGRLSPTLTAALDGFEVSRCEHGMTHLVGWVPDQARLHSLLAQLRDLNIELASVNPVPGAPTGSAATGEPPSTMPDVQRK